MTLRQRLAAWLSGSRKMKLCGRCAVRYRQTHSVELLRKPVNWKITCEECKRRRYGAEYRIRRK